jgi:hypothetical protein
MPDQNVAEAPIRSSPGAGQTFAVLENLAARSHVQGAMFRYSHNIRLTARAARLKSGV